MKRYSILQRYKSRGNLTWYGRISNDGIVRYVSLGVTRKNEAVEWLNLQNSRKFLPEAILEEQRDAKLLDACNAFLDTVSGSRGGDSLTFKAYQTRLHYLTRWCEKNGVATLRELTNEKASRYGTWVNGSFSPKTAREVIRVASQFCKFCSNTYDLLGWTPFMHIAKPKLEKRQKDFWTGRQIDKILDSAPDPEFRLFWSLMAFAGLRQAEACTFGPGMLTDDNQLHIVGKGNKEAFLPISDRLRAEIDRFGSISDGMFNHPKFKYSRSNDVLRETVERSGVVCDGECSNHRFRHSYASNLIRAGVNVRAVQQLMRHESFSTTMGTYSHLLKEDLTEAANALK